MSSPREDRAAPVHPGKILQKVFMTPFKLLAGDVARAAFVPTVLIEAILDERGSIGVATALKFARVFRTSPDYWLNMQRDYDVAAELARLGSKLDKCRCLNPEQKE